MSKILKIVFKASLLGAQHETNSIEKSRQVYLYSWERHLTDTLIFTYQTGGGVKQSTHHDGPV